MSVDYAGGLSDYPNKGKCGLPEIFDDEIRLSEKAKLLADWIRNAKHCVVYCGAGLSTAAGIPDFRGPKGVWTLEKAGNRIEASRLRSFDQCRPTFAHRAIRALIDANLVHFVVSQNIDGLLLRAGIARSKLAELHGNYFVDECARCRRRYIRTRPSRTMGCKLTGDRCPAARCRGSLADTILDWEQELPKDELRMAELHSNRSDLSICLGTTLQIEPAASLPVRVVAAKRAAKLRNRAKKRIKIEPKSTQEMKESNEAKIKEEIKAEEDEDEDEKEEKKISGKLVIVNLQPTRFDNRADLILNHYIDRVMEQICANLEIRVPPDDLTIDPTDVSVGARDLTEWIRDN